MALAYLTIFIIAIILIGILLQILLYKYKNNNIFYVINILFIFLISYINFSSQPTNYSFLKLLSLSWSIIGVVGVIPSFKKRKKITTTRYLISISLIGAIVQLLIV